MNVLYKQVVKQKHYILHIVNKGSEKSLKDDVSSDMVVIFFWDTLIPLWVKRNAFIFSLVEHFYLCAAFAAESTNLLI